MEGIASKAELEDIQTKSGIDSAILDYTTKVPDMPGQILVIESINFDKKVMALKLILANIQKLER
jgi:hypothetical protein